VVVRLPITVGAPRIVLEQLASASQLCPLPPGVDVVVEGAPAHAFYAVVEGSVVVHRNGEDVAHLGPGESFGGRGLLDNAPRNATVSTEVQSTILRIEGDVLLDALQAAPTVLSAIDRSNKGPWTASTAADQPGAMVDDPAWGRK
jgi:CRP-like cAMP-binding protein